MNINRIQKELSEQLRFVESSLAVVYDEKSKEVVISFIGSQNEGKNEARYDADLGDEKIIKEATRAILLNRACI